MAQVISSKTSQREYSKSSSFFMAMLFTILCGAAALCLGYFILYFAKGHFVQNTEEVLDTQILYLDTLYQHNQWPKQAGHIYIKMSQDDTIPEPLEGIISPSHDNLTTLKEGILLFDYKRNGSVYAAKVHTLHDHTKVIVGHDITEVASDFNFMKWLGVASIVFVMIVVFVSYLISVFVVDGTNRIAQAANEIIRTGDLSKRIEGASNWDDLGNMTEVLNLLLDRIEELFYSVRQVSDNIAHDLRTPVARLRNKIEASATLQDTEEQESLLKEVDRVLSTFNALLRISRIETEKAKEQFRSLDLRGLLHDVFEFYEPLATEKNIAFSIDVNDHQDYYGDKDLLFQAFANIVDNAIKYTPENGSVQVAMSCENGAIDIRFSDNGSGIPTEERDKIFRRFYRGDFSRTEDGMGLGLSLVAAVIDLHDGSIQVIDNDEQGITIITSL